MRRTGTLAFAVLGWLAAVPVRAEFEISLREGGTMVVRSYRIQANKLIAHKAAGTIEIALSRVVNIRDLGTTRVVAPEERAAPAASPAVQDDVDVRERELTRAIIVAHRDLASAQYRGEAKDAIERRKAEIARLEAERAAVHGPDSR